MAVDEEIVDAIFCAAIELTTPDERAAYVIRECGKDVELQRRVEALIAAHFRAGNFLESPALGLDATSDLTSSDPPGTVIGPYKVLEQIGEGGMGVVYMADQQAPVRRRVALKIIKPGMDTRQVIARFEAERQALALMDHPNIARVLDAGSTDSGRPYFVMELVRGVPITEYCDKNNLPVHERLELFVQVCQAVQHAHQKGIVHRDIKPSNVLVTLVDGRAATKVIDFGVAKAINQQLTEKTLFTNFSHMIGTPLYMSPEQAEMTSLDVDTRSDIYSLGVLLYELLTGTTPFDQKRIRAAALDEIRRIIREEEPPQPSTRISTLGDQRTLTAAHRKVDPNRLGQLLRGDLDWIVMKSIEKDRTQRYETASGLAMDIQRYLADEPVLACPHSATYRFNKFARKNKRFLATVAAFGTLLILASIGAGLAAVQSGRLAEKEHELRRDAEQRADAEAKARDQLDQRLYVNRIALAQQELFAQNPGRAQELLDNCPVSRRGWEWHFLKRFRPGNPLSPRGNQQSAAFSGDGRYLALRAGLDIDIVEPATGRKTRTLHGFTDWIDCYGLAFCPMAGETILAAGDANGRVVKLWNVETGQEIQTLAGHAPRLRTLAFSPNGERLAVGNISRGAKVWEWRTGHVVFELPHLSVSRFAYSPNGLHLAVAVFDGANDIIIYEAATGRVIRSFGKHNAGIEGVAYSPNSRYLTTCGSDGAVKIWDEATGEQLQTLRGHTGQVTDVVYAPDGERLASSGWDKTVKIWDTVTGQEMLTLRGHTGRVTKVEFSSNGQLLVSAGDDDVKIWNATPLEKNNDAAEAINVPGHTDCVKSVVFSPDGRLLASAAADRLIKVWELSSLTTGVKPVGLTLRGDTDIDMSLAFSPDSRRLASAGCGGSLKVWDALTGRSLLTLPLSTDQPGDDIRGIAFSADGQQLISLGPNALAVRDGATGQRLTVVNIPSGDLFGLACSPDGKHVATCAPVQIWNLKTAQAVRSLHEGGVVWRVAYSPDSQILACANFDHSIRIWDTNRWTEIRSLRGHTDRAMCVTFSPDRKYLASGSADSTVKLWDPASGQELATFRGHTGYVWSVAFSHDGTRLASAGGHHGKGEVKIWTSQAYYPRPANQNKSREPGKRLSSSVNC